MKIIIIGADGQLGSDLCKVIAKTEQIPLTIKDIDITNYSQTKEIIAKHQPNIVINTAGYSKVDDCEDNDELAFKVNALGVKNVALACKANGVTLVHISSDYVFDGEKNKSYIETDCPNPQSSYGISRLAGEYYIKYVLDNYFIVRSSGLYGMAGCMGKGGGNFVENMVARSKTQKEFKVVSDEILTPTYTIDLAKKINDLIKTKHYGLYHITNNGECSWYEFTCEIFRLLSIPAKVNKVAAVEYITKAKRPKYSVLENANLKKIGLDDLRDWRDALKAYLIEKGYLSGRQA